MKGTKKEDAYNKNVVLVRIYDTAQIVGGLELFGDVPTQMDWRYSNATKRLKFR